MRMAQLCQDMEVVPEAMRAYRELAEKALLHHESSLAEAALAKAVGLGSTDPQVYLLRARLALDRGQADQVESILSSAPQLNSNPGARQLLLKAHVATGNLEAAGRVAVEIFRARPDDFASLQWFSAQCLEMGQLDRALEPLAEASGELVVHGHTVSLLKMLEGIRLARPQHITTLELIRLVHEHSGEENIEFARVLELLATAYHEAGKVEAARTVCCRLVQIQPGSEVGQRLLSGVRVADSADADATAVETVEVNPELGNDFGADTETAFLVEEALENSELYASYGLADRAVQELEKVLAVYPDRLEIYRRILEICRESQPERAAQAAMELARICTSQNDSDNAQAYLEMAQQLGSASSGLGSTASPKTQFPQGPTEASAAVTNGVDVNGSVPMLNVPCPSCPSVEEVSAEWDLSAEWESLSDAGKQGPTTTTPAALDFSESRAEIQFYLEYGFVDEAFSAIERLQEKFPNHPQVHELQSMVKQQAERAIGETSPLAHAFTSAAIDLTESAAPERETGAVPGCEAGDDGQAADVSVNDLCFLGESTSVIEEPLGLPPAAPAADSPVPGSTPAEPVPCESGVSVLDAVGPAQSRFQEALPTAKDQTGSSRSNSPEASSPENGDLGDLSSLLTELDAAPEQSAVYEDIDVHYNLAVAFHEMELLDEAIGEFQRVVKGAEKELPSPRFLQACSLLAHCFTKKQMPELAVRWYQRALESPDLDEETRLALQYEMGVAYERAGDPRASLEYLLDVYSQNIDYRDVAERIRALQYKPIAKDHAGGSGRLHPSSLPANLTKSDASQLRPSPK